MTALRAITWACSIILCSLTSSALARETPILNPVGQDWKHAESGIVLPASIEQFTLDGLSDYTTSQSDVIARYHDNAEGDTLSVFVFRNGSGDVAVWQDRVLISMLSRSDHYGTSDVSDAIVKSFVPKGKAAKSGSLIVLPFSGGRVTASGSALMAYRDWLIAVHLSSVTGTSERVAQRLEAVAQAIALPGSPGEDEQPKSYVMKRCASSTPSQEAKRSHLEDYASLILAGFASSVIKESTFQDVASEQRWCRLASQNDLSVYVQGSAESGFIIALGDNGKTVNISDVGSGAKKLLDTRYFMSASQSERILIYRGFDAIPSPAQVMQIYQNEFALAAVALTPADRGDITNGPLAP